MDYQAAKRLEILVIVNDFTGYGKAVNQGLSLATQPWLLVCNNDIEWIEGELSDMCHSKAVMVPSIVPMPRDLLPRAVFCMPRETYQKVGGFDERFEGGYFEDDDYIMRLREAGIPMGIAPHVKARHLDGGGLTMKTVGEQKHFDANKARFEEKWKSQ